MQQPLQRNQSTNGDTRLRLIGEAITGHWTQHPFRQRNMRAIRTSNDHDWINAVAAKIPNDADFYSV